MKFYKDKQKQKQHPFVPLLTQLAKASLSESRAGTSHMEERGDLYDKKPN